MSSILNSTKKVLGLAEDYEAFDDDILTHINSVFFTLWQLGIGPEKGFEVKDSSEDWASYINGDSRLSAVPSYMYIRVRLLFDPPANSFTIDALKKQGEELEWRLTVLSDQKKTEAKANEHA